MKVEQPVPEFSRPIAVAAIDRRGVNRVIEASEAERRALAARFDLVAVDRLVATVRLRAVNGGTAIRLDARFDADVVQRCVVTLEPVPATVGEDFVLLYSREDGGEEVELAFEDEVVEPLEGDAIDVGEAVAQELAIALDPYPRAPGATVPPLDDATDARHEGTSSQEGAFAALARARGVRRGRDV
ncbi:MAG: DUF177 domain-containing protein [Alphaproteobacteria bacterium]|nr:DUF177 domain-containing protein [Alphaproteobacteria bacterium]